MSSIEAYQISAIARMFSSSVAKELASSGQSRILGRLLRESSVIKEFKFQGQLKEFLDHVFCILQNKNYRHEYIYKAALTHKVLMGKHSLNTASMLNEFRVGKNKADIIILNGTSTAYEIKSERDNLSKLERQISAFRKVFATVNVVIGENHLDSAKKILEPDVGIMILSARNQISTFREGQNITSRLCVKSIFESIQKREAKIILRDFGVKLPNVPNIKEYQMLLEHFLNLTPEEAHAGFVKVLKTTRTTNALKSFVNEVPHSFQPIMLTTRIPQKEYKNIITAMNTPIHQALNWN